MGKSVGRVNKVPLWLTCLDEIIPEILRMHPFKLRGWLLNEVHPFSVTGPIQLATQLTQFQLFSNVDNVVFRMFGTFIMQDVRSTGLERFVCRM